MATPTPGRRVRGSTTGRPIMALLDLLGRRGTLRIAWELRDGPLPFRELQRRAEISSPNLLSSRLREGLETRLMEQDEDGRYRLTREGRELGEILLPLDRWAKKWARRSGGRRQAGRAR